MNKQKSNLFPTIFLGILLFFSGYFSDNLFYTDSEICIRSAETQNKEIYTKRQTKIRIRIGRNEEILFCRCADTLADDCFFQANQKNLYFSECFILSFDIAGSSAEKMRENLRKTREIYLS